MDGVETTRRVMRSDENEKQASPTSVHSHAQNDLVLAIILRYVSFSQDSTPKDRHNEYLNAHEISKTSLCFWVYQPAQMPGR